MSEGQKAGGIYIEIEAETANLIDGQRKANQALDNIGSNAQKTSGQFKRLDTQLNATSKVMSSGLRGSVQQAGYQIQDFIVQVQGGQSALVAFSQQGSQLAGAFGPAGAVFGAVLALSTVVAGALITSLNGGKNAMDALKDAAESMDKVITISNQGVAALSDKYAVLARTNADVATILRNQALLEYNNAIAKIPKAISDASDSFITLGDRAIAAIGGASPSIKKFNDELTGLKITTDDWSEAITQANSLGQYATGVTRSLSATVNTLAGRLGISQQEAFALAKQLSELSNNPTPEALQKVIIGLQNMKTSTKEGQDAVAGLVGTLKDLWIAALDAKQSIDSVSKATDNLTAGQKNLIQQSERTLALSKLQGKARARLQAQYAAEDAGFSKDDPHTKRMMDDAAATYTNLDSQKKLKAEQKKGESQAERNAKVVEEYSQKAKLAADSTSELSREQAILAAKQKLTNATPQQVAQVERDAAAAWDTANALKAQAAAQKLLPETRENASYQQDMKDLKTALDGKRITQQQYDQTSEQLEAQHQANLAKIRAQQVVNPTQQALGEIDPVQQLANQHAQELALIQQFETQKGQITQRGLELMNAANTQYEQQRIAAQWEIWRQQNAGYEVAAAAFDSFAGNASNALTGILTGSMSVSEAMRSLGSTVLNSVINSFVQMGVEWLKSVIMGQAGMTAASGMAIAQGQLIAASMAPAAAMTSLATAGANAIPAQAGIASTVGMAQALSIAGARYNGGSVSAGGLYQVGEKGKPEIYQASNGSQYMIPGDNGKVISNKDMQSGGGISVQVIVNNQATSATVQSADGYMQDGSAVVELLLTDIDRGGPVSSQFQQTFGLNRKASGAY